MALDRLQSFGHLREVDLENGRVTSVISTGDIARDGAIIDPAGWRFDNYDRNPIVLWMHDATLMPFARTVEHLATDSELIARAQFDLDDPFGVRILAKIAAGYVSATSVRWLPLATEVRRIGEGKEARDVLVFTEQELLECSFVTVPADPKALILRADGAVFDYSSLLPKAEPEISVAEEHITAAEDYSRLTPALASYIERRLQRATVDDMIVMSLAKATGKTEERIRREIAG